MTKFFCADCGNNSFEIGDIYVTDGTFRFCGADCAANYFSECVIDCEYDDYMEELYQKNVEFCDLHAQDPFYVAQVELWAEEARLVAMDY